MRFQFKQTFQFNWHAIEYTLLNWPIIKSTQNKQTLVYHGPQTYWQLGYLSTQWSKCCGFIRRNQVSLQQILTTLMTLISFSIASTDHLKLLSIFFTTIWTSQFPHHACLKAGEGVVWCKQHNCWYSYRQQQISQSDFNITSNCDKKY